MTHPKSIFYLILLLCLSLTACSRYHNIPRQIDLFDHSKSENAKQNAISNKRLKDNNQSLVSTKALKLEREGDIDPSQPNIVLDKVSIQNQANKLSPSVIKDKLLVKKLGGRVNELQEISYHQTQIRNKLQRVKSKTDDPQETESEFHPLAAISGILGIVSWAAFIFMELYWSAFWTEYLILVSILAALGALITGIIALALTKKSKGDFNNRYMAVIGIVMGGIEVLALVLVIISFLLFFGL